MLALGRARSVAGAARLLGIDNSTVSRRLATVEEALGACLIVRGGREFTFTAEGKLALAAAESMGVSAGSAATAIRAAKTQLDGVVRISCIPSMVRVLMPFQALVAEKHPKLSVELNSAVRVVDLAKGEADISIRMVRPTELDVIPTHAFEWGASVFASKIYLE
ncbi:MAG: LysR family transcriptional regulator [Rhizobiales bacterium]|nr:LysR family transcriptional regulator [Hyphomicrobiales bacterium]MBI3674258.1 LysR family transcriptional regulator [Hyphomicrobiales bacterium]